MKNIKFYLSIIIFFVTNNKILIAQTVNYQTLHTGATFDARNTDTNKPVGSTPGAADVASGAASYTIPIAVPQGTNGVVPSLSVSYNSMGGNGILGMGWGLTGLSAISRGTKSYYFDGKVSTVDLTNNDVFYLDGVRLVTITGNNGENNTDYKTEAESFSTITSYKLSELQNNVLIVTADWFKVITKDGLEMEFGKTNDAKVATEPNGITYLWRVNRIKYSDGNYIDFIYTGNWGKNGTFESVLDEIKYTGNVNAGLSPYNSIKFNYVERNDKVTHYLSNAQYIYPNKNSFLVDKIIVKSDGATAKSYQFNYASDVSTPAVPSSETINSYLKEVIEFGSNGTALNSTIFKYGNIPQEITAGASNIVLSTDSQYWPGDFNGDGVNEILEVKRAFNNNVIYNPSFKAYKRVNDYEYTAGTEVMVPTNGAIFDGNLNNFRLDQKAYLTNDYNGDGSDDILILQKSGSGNLFLTGAIIYPSLNNGTDFGAPVTLNLPLTTYDYIYPSNNVCFTGDFDGNGAKDIMIILGQTSPLAATTKVYMSWGNLGIINTNFVEIDFNFPNFPVLTNKILAEASQINVIDFDGDGKSEFHIINKSNGNNINEIYGFYKSSNEVYVPTYYSANLPSTLTNDTFIYYGDFNGDAKTDFIYKQPADESTTSWNICHSTGKRFNTSTITFAAAPSDQTNKYFIRTGDFNGDGKTDLLHGVSKTNYSDPTSYNIYYSKGQSFYKIFSEHSRSAGPLNDINLFDTNSDGRMDIVTKPGTSNQIDLIRFRMYGQEHLLQKVKTGTGLVTEFQYKRLSEGAPFYTQGPISTASSLVQNIGLPLYNVSNLIAQTGITGTTTTNTAFSYESLKLHKQGRGLLGYFKITSSNNETGYKSVTENEFNSTFHISLPKTSSTFLISGNKLMSETILTNVVDNLGGKRYFVRNTESTTNNYFEGVPGNKTFSTTSNTSYDSFGNILISSTNVNNIETTTTTTEYIAKPGSINNKPSSITVLKTRGNDTKSIQTTFEYDGIGQIIKKIDFANLTEKITTEYGYKVSDTPSLDKRLGNITSIKITPYGMTPRITSSIFDSKGRAAETTKNVLDQITTTAYNWLWGKPSRTTSLNGINTDYYYDDFGRASSTNYKVSLADAYTISQDYSWDISGNQIYKTKITHPGKPDVTTWSDILGREIKTETEGFGGNIYTDQTYNPNGTVATTTKPYKSGEATLITTNNYDVVFKDRLQSIASNVSAFGSSSVVYSFANGNLTTTTTTPNGQTSSKTTDATGKVISANDPGGTLTYTYNSQGNLLKVNNGTKDVTDSNYDDYGRQMYLIDLNAGRTDYTYDALGQLITETNAHRNSAGNPDQTTIMVYDISGRVVTRTGPEGTTTNTYNTSGSGINQLNTVTSFAGNTESYTYNGYGQLQSTTEAIDSKSFTTSYTYNKYDDVTQKTYPSGLKIGYNYDGNGYISQINNVTTGSYTIYANTGINGFGQNTTYATGNGKTSTNTYYYGFPKRFQTTGVQDLNMEWEYNTGNLKWRHDLIKNKKEVFGDLNGAEDYVAGSGYDNQNRLKKSQIIGLANSTINITYENLGNITSKTDAGTYSYDGAKINAVASVSNSPNSTIPLLQQNISYNSFQQPTSIAENGNTLAYTYGSDYNRIKSVLNKGGVITTRYYFGDYEETTTNGVEKKLAYISSPAGLIAIVEGTTIVHYTYTDHLGSIVAAQNADDSFFEQNFDAWGRRRDPTAWSTYAPTATVPNLPDWLYRGYTGHEMLDAFGLINMNARLYDPVVGRVLSPDNYVQAPYSTQNYNRYSYALNNPLKYTDPDGNFVWFAPLLVAVGTEIFKSAIQPGGLKANWNWGSLFTNVVTSYLSAGIASGIGASFGATGTIGKEIARAAAHGLSGGIMSYMQGGKFLPGAGASFAGSLIGSSTSNLSPLMQASSSIAAGGFTSIAMGGDFMQGAINAGIVVGFNHFVERMQSKSWDLNHDGHLQKEEADAHYRDGNGTSIHVNVKEVSITISDLIDEGWNSKSKTKGVQTLLRKNGKIYGNVTLHKTGNRTYEILPDEYNFEQHGDHWYSSPVRNPATTYGGWVSSDYGNDKSVNSFKIYFTGKIRIPSKAPNYRFF